MVESAAHATVQPNHARATLGMMLCELPKIANLLVFEIEGTDPQASIEMVRLMMRQLWDGAQTPVACSLERVNMQRGSAEGVLGVRPGRGRFRASPGGRL
ncbi:hypothetical protein [Streptomyces sp. CBMA123]|uniref:hypothetical protein n=1 Tax=Streptomyces sp. CBMA123 TaxID=1896313 RepID=UPI001661CD2B|nr:hypothetical protein [Streptomyces sp. CBMA123]MBD0695845.1 hypothetical protein [Streptomyces sp. CBMA123]